MIRRLLTTLARVGISVGLIAYVFIRFIDLHDRPVCVVRAPEGEIVGEHVREDAHGIVVRVGGAERSFPPGTRHEDRTAPGFLTLLAGIRPVPFAFFFLLNAVPIGFCALRWWLLLRDQSVPIPLREALRMYYVGVFLNNFFPGGVGGDLARGVMAYRSTENRRSRMVGTIVLDRLIGLISLAAMSALAGAAAYDRPEYWIPSVVIWAMLGMVAVGYAVYFNAAVRRSGFGRWIKDRLPAREALAEIDAVFQSFRSNPRLIGVELLLSVIAQSLAIVCLWGFALSMGIREAGPADYFTFFPIVAILTAIPISFGGWGFGEVNFQYFFGFAGMPPGSAVALSILFRTAGMLVTLPAAFFMTQQQKSS